MPVAHANGLAAEEKLERSKEARDAQTSQDIQSDRLERILLATMKHFVADLLPWTQPHDDSTEAGESESGQGLKGVLMLLQGGEAGWWGVRSRWGWYREFVRRVSLLVACLGHSTFSVQFGRK